MMKILYLLIYLLLCADVFAHNDLVQNNLAHRTSNTILVKSITLNEDPWPPYINGIEGGEAINGIAVDVLRLLFERLGVELSLSLFPWQRSVDLVKKGIDDGHMLLASSPERKAYMVYSIPFIEDKYLLWFRVDRKKPIVWETANDLTEYSIALAADYRYSDTFEADAKNAGVVFHYSKSDEINFRLLAAQRLDAIVCLERVAKSLFKKHPHFQGQFLSASRPVASMPMMMSIAKDSSAAVLMPQINQQLKMLISDGHIEKIIKQYD
jgi:polar amino acid transport system substrate-binding protein